MCFLKRIPALVRISALALIWHGPAVAEDQVPPAEYFTGTYQRVGRDGATPPGLVDDLVRIDPGAAGLELRGCAAGADAPAQRLAFDGWGEVPNLLSGGAQDPSLWCLYHNDGNNYPLLNCAAPDGRRFTLWPVPDMACAR
ncbi:hypothetical protein [Gemmobacter serpentinus]|uniref:hypothetical protein n=1 Tax=Gemmobacter serpentinus TaxID=2652247 RepID=UPI00186579AB|nr:hypothetical protein [Gemmobacter serpentinus]